MPVMFQALPKGVLGHLFLSSLVMSKESNILLGCLFSTEPQMQVDWSTFLWAGVTGMPW